MGNQFQKLLPPNCHIDKGIYIRFQKQVRGEKYNFQLGKISDGINQIRLNYKDAIEILFKDKNINTLNWLSSKFQQSPRFRGLSIHTQPRYITASRILNHQIKLNDTSILFGDLLLSDITKPFVRQLMQIRLDQYKANGKKGESAVNYEVAYLSSMITWGLNNLHGLDILFNPLLNIEKFKTPKNERYVTDSEYLAQYKLASPVLQAFFEICYLCACRSIEARNLIESDDYGDKLLIRRTKGSKHTLINVSPRLRLAIDKAKALRPVPRINIPNNEKNIFTNISGYQLSRSGINSAMKRLKKKVGEDYWNLHLLKSKGISDASDKGIAGLTEAMKRRYSTKIECFDAVG